MADTSTNLDRPARKVSILEKGRSHKGQGLVNKKGVVKLLPSFCKIIVKMTDVRAGASSCRSLICLKPVTESRFFIVFFQYLQCQIFIVFSSNVFAFFFSGTCIATPSPEKKSAHKTFFAFNNYWSFAVFGGPYFIANFPNIFKIITEVSSLVITLATFFSLYFGKVLSNCLAILTLF